MNCKNCEYGLKQSCGDFEKIICTYEEGECVKITELEKQNAELDCQKNRNKACYSCANATERCFRNEIGCPCQNYKSYKDENAELKEQNTNLQEMLKTERSVTCKEEYLKKVTELEQENAELKEEIKNNEDLATVAYMQGAERQKKKSEKQLAKAKRYIKELLRAVESSYSVLSWQRPPIKAEAEQFIKDSEVEK